MSRARDPRALHDELLAYALGFPEAWEDHPWGEAVAKVRKKVFVFFGVAREERLLHLSVKLPESGQFVLAEPWAAPTGYGLGKSGWVSIEIGAGTANPPDAQYLRDLIDESYRAVAPKTLVKQLDEQA